VRSILGNLWASGYAVLQSARLHLGWLLTRQRSAKPQAAESAPRVLLLGLDATASSHLRGSRLLEGCWLEEVETDSDALFRLRLRSFDVVVTDPSTSVSHDLQLCEEIRRIRPGVRVILLAPGPTPEEVIASLRAHAFACCGAPYDWSEVAHLIREALAARHWRDGIEVVSAHPEWLSVRVNCRLLSAERLVLFLRQLRPDIAPELREHGLLAFREILLNAMEHGAAFDPDKVVEVSAVRTARSMVYYVRDPGPGFRMEDLRHAAIANPPDDPIAHLPEREARGLRAGGFGILLAKRVVDEMIYSERGNEVILVKHV
jgi:anti-sigma regulatory factor (Ser/Thr protein kinase)